MWQWILGSLVGKEFINIIIYDNEIWKDIKGYEGYYQISSYGRVKSLERLDSYNRKIPERILSASFGGSGYLNAGLSKNGIVKLYQVHTLVAMAFIPNPFNKPQIDHIDGCKTNNHVNNLQWVTPKENMANANTREKLLNRPRRVMSEDTKQKIREAMRGRTMSEESKKKLSEKLLANHRRLTDEHKERLKKSHEKPIICLDDGKIFKSGVEASKYYNILSSTISKACRGKVKTAHGKRFAFYNVDTFAEYIDE